MACLLARDKGSAVGQTRWPGHRYLTITKSKQLHDLLEPSLASLGYDLVQVRLLSGGRPTLQIYAEPLSGAPMSVDDCQAVSRHISAVLDVEDPIAGAYNLEVGSPGIDRPLVKAADFDRFRGEEAKIETTVPVDGGRKRFRGMLEGIANEQVQIRVEEKVGTTTTFSIPLTNIATAKLVLTDQLIARDAQRRTNPTEPDAQRRTGAKKQAGTL